MPLYKPPATIAGHVATAPTTSGHPVTSPQDLKCTYVDNVTTTGFDFWYKERNGLGLSAHWIATDAGNP